MSIDIAIKELENIINSSTELSSIPYTRGKSIRIKNYAIRKTKDKYVVFDCKNNKKISELNFRISAISFAKTLSENKDFTRQIMFLDQKLLKHYNDILFYKNVIKNSASKKTKESRKARLEVSLYSVRSIRNQLEDFVFNDK